MKAWFVYILRCADGTLYSGITNDLDRRLAEHNSGQGAKYTRGRRPAKFIYSKKCESRSAALKEESKIRKLPRKEKINLSKSAKKEPVSEEKKLPAKLFQVINEGFICANCKSQVLPTTCGAPRNHCPFCLYSKHVDINVGDRANPCRGLMKPIGVITDSRKDYIIIYKCLKCKEGTRSKYIPSSDVQPDNFDLLVKLSTKPTK